jgi:hypothetical protein
MLKIFHILLPALLLLNDSCKKEKEPGFTITEILISGKWQLKRLWVETHPGSGAADITNSTFDACELDDIFEFKPGEILPAQKMYLYTR